MVAGCGGEENGCGCRSLVRGPAREELRELLFDPHHTTESFREFGECEPVIAVHRSGPAAITIRDGHASIPAERLVGDTRSWWRLAALEL